MKEFFGLYATEIFALINTILVVFLLPMLSAWLREHLTAKRAERVELAVQSGINAAIASLTQGKNSTDTLKSVLNDAGVRTQVIGLATDYVHSTVPGAVKKLGIDGAVADVVSARVEGAVASLAEKYTTVNTAIQKSEKTYADFSGGV